MSTISHVPATYDIDYILGKMQAGGVLNHFGYAVEGDFISIRYRAPDFDIVQSVLDEYQTSYADEVLRDRVKEQVTEIRRSKQASPANFMGMQIPTDDVTVGRITAAAYLMDANPASPQARRWKVTGSIWITLDRTTLVGMGTAIANHIQQCFEREEELTLALDAALTADEILALDIQSGWPT